MDILGRCGKGGGQQEERDGFQEDGFHGCAFQNEVSVSGEDVLGAKGVEGQFVTFKHIDSAVAVLNAVTVFEHKVGGSYQAESKGVTAGLVCFEAYVVTYCGCH